MIYRLNRQDIALLLIGIIGLFFSIYNHNGNKIHYYILPFCYVINVAFIRSYNLFANNISLFIIDTLMCIRYVVLPLSYYTSTNNPFAFHYQYEFVAIFMLVYEMIMVTMTINIFAPKIFLQNIEKEQAFQSGIKLKSPGIIIIILLLGLVLITMPQYMTNLFTFRFSDMQEVENTSSIKGMYNIIYKTGIIIVGCVIMSKFSRIEEKQTKHFISCLLISWLIIWMSSIGTSGIVSRTTFLTNGIIFTIMVLRIFPERSRFILCSSLSVTFLFLILGTIFRFYSNSRVSIGEEILAYEVLDSYFGGLRNLTVAIRMDDLYGDRITFSTLLNDLFAGFPFFATRIGLNFDDRIVYYFNATFFGFTGISSRICPLIGQGYSYLGLLFSPLFSCFCVYGAMKINRIMRKTKNEILIYIACLLTFYLSAYSMYNLNIITGGLWNKILPIYLVYLLSKE